RKGGLSRKGHRLAAASGGRKSSRCKGRGDCRRIPDEAKPAGQGAGRLCLDRRSRHVRSRRLYPCGRTREGKAALPQGACSWSCPRGAPRVTALNRGVPEGREVVR